MGVLSFAQVRGSPRQNPTRRVPSLSHLPDAFLSRGEGLSVDPGPYDPRLAVYRKAVPLPERVVVARYEGDRVRLPADELLDQIEQRLLEERILLQEPPGVPRVDDRRPGKQARDAAQEASAHRVQVYEIDIVHADQGGESRRVPEQAGETVADRELDLLQEGVDLVDAGGRHRVREATAPAVAAQPLDVTEHPRGDGDIVRPDEQHPELPVLRAAGSREGLPAHRFCLATMQSPSMDTSNPGSIPFRTSNTSLIGGYPSSPVTSVRRR